jgi:hypothetical protein
VTTGAWLGLIYLINLGIAVAVAFDLRRLNVEGWAIYALVVFLFPLIGIVAWVTARNKRMYVNGDSNDPPSRRAFPF